MAAIRWVTSSRTLSRGAAVSVVQAGLLCGEGVLSGRVASQAAKPLRLNITQPGTETGRPQHTSLRKVS